MVGLRQPVRRPRHGISARQGACLAFCVLRVKGRAAAGRRHGVVVVGSSSQAGRLMRNTAMDDSIGGS